MKGNSGACMGEQRHSRVGTSARPARRKNTAGACATPRQGGRGCQGGARGRSHLLPCHCEVVIREEAPVGRVLAHSSCLHSATASKKGPGNHAAGCAGRAQAPGARSCPWASAVPPRRLGDTACQEAAKAGSGPGAARLRMLWVSGSPSDPSLGQLGCLQQGRAGRNDLAGAIWHGRASRLTSSPTLSVTMICRTVEAEAGPTWKVLE